MCDHSHWIHHITPITYTHPSPQGGFKPIIPASEQPQTHASDHEAPGMNNAIFTPPYTFMALTLKDIKNFNIIIFQFKLQLGKCSIN
jgi:hypothetical protein